MGRIKFSIIVAVAPDRNPEVIKTLKEQDYPSDKYEILIKRGPNASVNRNVGVKEAKGEIIAFIDDDAIVEKNWLIKAERFFVDHPEIDVVGGPQLTPLEDNWWGYISGIALANMLGGASIRNRYRKGLLNLNSDERDLTTANVFCRREVFLKAKFNSNFWPGEDPVFFNELVSKGKRLAYYPDLYVYHRRRDNMLSFIKQIFSYGFVRPGIKSIKKTKKSSFLFLVPSIFVLYLFFLPLLFRMKNVFFLPLLVYIIIVSIISVIFFIKEKKYKYLMILLPFIFLLIHVSYGFGFIFGFLKASKILSKKASHLE